MIHVHALPCSQTGVSASGRMPFPICTPLSLCSAQPASHHIPTCTRHTPGPTSSRSRTPAGPHHPALRESCILILTLPKGQDVGLPLQKKRPITVPTSEGFAVGGGPALSSPQAGRQQSHGAVPVLRLLIITLCPVFQGNDQVRFELTCYSLAPQIKVRYCSSPQGECWGLMSLAGGGGGCRVWSSGRFQGQHPWVSRWRVPFFLREVLCSPSTLSDH